MTLRILWTFETFSALKWIEIKTSKHDMWTGRRGHCSLRYDLIAGVIDWTWHDIREALKLSLFILLEWKFKFFPLSGFPIFLNLQFMIDGALGNAVERKKFIYFHGKSFLVCSAEGRKKVNRRRKFLWSVASKKDTLRFFHPPSLHPVIH